MNFDVTQWPHRGITPFEEIGIEALVEMRLMNEFERIFINNLMNRLAACELTVLSAKQRVSLWSILGRHKEEIQDAALRCVLEQVELYRDSVLRARESNRESQSPVRAFI
jgi:hypothetical protein